jgi:hypothetical protein
MAARSGVIGFWSMLSYRVVAEQLPSPIAKGAGPSGVNDLAGHRQFAVPSPVTAAR